MQYRIEIGPRQEVGGRVGRGRRLRAGRGGRGDRRGRRGCTRGDLFIGKLRAGHRAADWLVPEILRSQGSIYILKVGAEATIYFRLAKIQIKLL